MLFEIVREIKQPSRSLYSHPELSAHEAGAHTCKLLPSKAPAHPVFPCALLREPACTCNLDTGAHKD